MHRSIPVPKPKRTPQKKRFHARRDPAYMAWIHTQRCVIAGRRWGGLAGEEPHRCCTAVEGCHVRSRGAAGEDQANLVPMCRAMHTQQHAVGIRSFQARWDVSLKAEAAALWERYQAERAGDLFMRAYE